MYYMSKLVDMEAHLALELTLVYLSIYLFIYLSIIIVHKVKN